MNKMGNTVLFVIVASLINLVVMAALFLISLILLNWYVPADSPYSTLFLGLTILFSVGGTFLIYQFTVKKLTERYNLKEHLDPIFWKKRKDKKRIL
ncbi:MAG: hypothetical protein WDA17_02010 [Sphaerochaetaceae bacterium]